MKYLTAGFAIFLSAVSIDSHANKVKTLSIDTLLGMQGAPTILVYSSSGEKWDKVDKSEATDISVHLNAKCKYEGKGNKAYKGSFGVYGFTAVGDTEPADFLIPHASEAKGKFRYSGHDEFNPLQVCANELEKRLSEQADKTKYHVLAQGFKVDYPAAVTASYGLTCKPTGAGFTDYQSTKIKINASVKCQASAKAESKIPKPKPEPKRASFIPMVKDVKFHAVPAKHAGKCPVAIEFKGKITATRAGEVKYRIVSHDGRESPTFTLKFDKAGTQATGKWMHTANKAKVDPGKTLSAGGATKPEWDFKGWQRLEILSPEPTAAVTAEYQGKCAASAAVKAMKSAPERSQKQ